MTRDGRTSAAAGPAYALLTGGAFALLDGTAAELAVLRPLPGLALGLLLGVRRRRLAAFLAAAAALLAARLLHPDGLGPAGAYAAGDLAEVASGWWLAGRLAGRPAALAGVRRLAALGAAALAAPAVGAAVVAAVASLSPAPFPAGACLGWWSAGALGMLLFAPAVAALGPGAARRDPPSRRPAALLRAGELACACGVVAGSLWAMLHYQRYGLPSLFVPPLLWLALRSGVAATATAAAAVAAVMVLAAGRGAWPFPFGIGFVPPANNGPFRFVLLLMALPPVTVAVAVAEGGLARRALAAGERRYALALAAGGMGTWERDVAADRLTWDEGERRLFGLAPGARGPSTFRDFLALVHPDDRAGLAAADGEAAAGGGTSDREFRVVWPDGTVRWIADRCAATYDASGRLVRMIGVSQDATARKAAEARLARQAEALRELAVAAERGGRAKADFLASMSHEIRTPMTGVLGMADLLAASDLPAREAAYVAALRASGRHLLSIINDVLDFSRIEAGRLELEAVDFPVAEILQEVRSLLAPQAVERGVALTLAAGTGVPAHVRGDPTRLRQVLLNLAGNALKFTHEGGVDVRVAGRPGPDPGRVRLRFEVRDSGIGIAPERQAEIFEAFTQADGSTARRYGGSGLGLAICARLVGAMGGTIGLESEPGRGSLFWFELPLAVGDTSGAVAAAAADGATPEAALPPLEVLLAEDVPLNRDLLGDVLGRRGHRVAFAADGAEALALASSGRRFDLVLMDVQMPRMDGIEAARRIRALPPPAGAVPIVALTANVMEAERRRCLEAGMDRVVAKPVAWPELFAAMAAVHGRDGAAAPSSPAGPGSPAERAPLLDREVLAGLGGGMDPGALAGFLGEGVDEAERAHAALAALPGRPGELAGVAHRLRGTAGTLGLARVAALAGAIEEAAGRGGDAAALVGRLGEAVAATREEVRRWPGAAPGA